MIVVFALSGPFMKLLKFTQVFVGVGATSFPKYPLEDPIGLQTCWYIIRPNVEIPAVVEATRPPVVLWPAIEQAQNGVKL